MTEATTNEQATIGDYLYVAMFYIGPILVFLGAFYSVYYVEQLWMQVVALIVVLLSGFFMFVIYGKALFITGAVIWFLLNSFVIAPPIIESTMRDRLTTPKVDDIIILDARKFNEFSYTKYPYFAVKVVKVLPNDEFIYQYSGIEADRDTIDDYASNKPEKLKFDTDSDTKVNVSYFNNRYPDKGVVNVRRGNLLL